MQIILESVEELKEICSLVSGKVLFNGECQQAKSEEPKIEIKPVAEKVKKDKPETRKAEKAKTEDKKNETPKVDAEVVGVDTTSTEPPRMSKKLRKKTQVKKSRLLRKW